MKRPGRMAWCAAQKTSVRFIISNGKSFKAESTTSRQAPQPVKPQLQDVERGLSPHLREKVRRKRRRPVPLTFIRPLSETPPARLLRPPPPPPPLSPLSAAADAIKTYHGTKTSAFLLNAPPLSARRCTPPPSIPAARPSSLWVR